MEQETRKAPHEDREHHHERHTESQRKQLRVSDLLFAVKKHLVLVLVCTAAGLAAGICLSVVSHMRGEINKQYEITSAIAVTSQNANGLFTSQSNNPGSNDIYLAENMVDSVIFVMKSDRTLDAAVARLNLLGISTKDIYNNLTLQQYKSTQVVQVSLCWRSAQEGVEILNAINQVAPDILVDTLKLGSVSIINDPKATYLVGGSINASMWFYMMMLGCMIGVGFAVLQLLLYPTLLKPMDMERVFSVEVLGEIPERKKYFGKKRNLLLADSDDEDNAEVIDGFASLAHILKKRLEGYEHPCVYVTSAVQNEGKTTVTSTLAVQLSEVGMRVLMVDFDTRNPKLGGMFLNKVEYEHSINALYRGVATKEDAITHLTGTLDILPAMLEKKPLPYDDAMLDLVRDLKNQYDVILMDTAPVGQVADTMSLNLLADVALLVVRFDGASMEILRDSLARLEKSGAVVMGCIVNGVKELGKPGYYSGSGSQYGSGKPHRQREKTEQEKEWEKWDKKRKAESKASAKEESAETQLDENFEVQLEQAQSMKLSTHSDEQQEAH